MPMGRFFCVSIPFILTLASLALLLVAVLPVWYPMFTVTPKDLKLPIDILPKLSGLSLTDIQKLGQTLNTTYLSPSTLNITAADLGLADSYSYYLFTYSKTVAGATTKNATAFDYASKFSLASFNATVQRVAAAEGVTASIPKAVSDALTIYEAMIKYAEIVFIIAVALGGATGLVGLLGFCSKWGSCITYIVSGIATIAGIAFAALCTVLSVIAVGVFTAFSHWGVQSSLGMTFLILIWLAVACSIAAGLFWLFTICCCSAARRERRSKHISVVGPEKRFSRASSGYQPVHDPFLAPGQESGVYNGAPQHSYPLQPIPFKSAAAYEPYKQMV